jgi:hypothetical protein
MKTNKKILKSRLRSIIREQLGSDRMHQCFGGDQVPFGSPDCLDDLQLRLDDATLSRNSCSIRSDARDYYNGLLKVLRRDMRGANKAHAEMWPEQSMELSPEDNMETEEIELIVMEALRKKFKLRGKK